ncbi:N-acetylmuramoyl-L-alanine amidase [Shimazuella sp. AN120528]|uniref:peptidoglycan recognition protein family protein n=1 Tax=Shimazuella soli TaxID=1892854 RepID=UPI001F0D73A4|nr:N-acetylmuramoyl-L-alanine amidase [Shimazuella soli]MCH5586325.1 N-acetylmuramoyl-L-alanine amidase [Shimazuella soli]
MEIKQRLIPTKYTNIRPRIKLVPKYITVHETANVSRGADAAAHASLLERGNSRTASWHFTCDDHQIIQHIPENEVSWHAGDGRNGTGNRQSLSLEICVNQDGNYEKAKENAIWLIQYLMRKHNVPIERVVPHKIWSGKDCPHKLLPYWSEFVSRLKGTNKPSIPSYPGTLLKRGSKGENVKLVQRKLGGLIVDGIFGIKTETAVKKFQKAKRLVVDGIVGPTTWSNLFR